MEHPPRHERTAFMMCCCLQYEEDLVLLVGVGPVL